MNILTDEEIVKACNATGSTALLNKIARAIEAAVLLKLSEKSGVKPFGWLCDGEFSKYEAMQLSSLFSAYVPVPGQEKLYTEVQLLAAQQNAAHKAGDVMREKIASYVETQRNDVPATGIEFASTIRAIQGVTLENLKD